MLCPKCNKEMIVIERNEVELDWCMECEGFWFDYDEWNILSKKLIAQNMMDNSEDIFVLPPALTGEKPARCPVCGKKMEKFMLFDVLLDRCPKKHGLWFDKGEFSKCLNSLSKGNSKSKRMEFLGETFTGKEL